MTTQHETDEFPDKKPAWWRRPGCLLLLASGLLILASFYAFCIYVPPLRISEETTRITGPLTPDGQIDFLKHLEETTYPPEMKTDDNGFRIFVRTFGDISDSRSDEFYWKQRCEKLGLDPNEKPTMTMPPEPYKIVTEFLKQKGETPSDRPWESFAKPWTVDDFPMLEDWLAEIEAPLDAVSEMIRKPVFFPPLLETPETARTGHPQNLIDILLPDAQLCRTLTRQFQARANCRIALGNINGAIDDTTTILLFARKISADGGLVQRLIGLALEGVALSVPIAGNPEHPPSMEQLKRLFEAMKNLPQAATMETVYEWERCASLSAIQQIFEDGGFTHATLSGDIVDGLAWRCDKNVTYRYVNEAYDTLTGKRPRSEYSRYATPPRTSSEIAKGYLTSMGRGALIAKQACPLMLPALEAAEEAVRRNECTLNMKRLMLALLMYKTEHGKFPREDWFERIKPYLGEEPERCLRCPSCVSLGFGTNYALILHEKEPADSDAFLLVELREPVPPEEAFFTPEQALEKFSKRMIPKPIGSRHPGGLNTARCNGALLFFSETKTEKGGELQRLLGLEIPKEEETEF